MGVRDGIERAGIVSVAAYLCIIMAPAAIIHMILGLPMMLITSPSINYIYNFIIWIVIALIYLGVKRHYQWDGWLSFSVWVGIIFCIMAGFQGNAGFLVSEIEILAKYW